MIVRWCAAGLAVLVSAAVFLAGAACSSVSLVTDGRNSQSTFRRGVVAADHEIASRAGLEMLEKGGNAVDAAVATSFCLSVVRPYSCGIGGGGFMVIHLVDDPRTEAAGDAVDVALDYRERAPGAMTPDHFEGLAADASQLSGSAVAVPGTVAGLLHALEEYGTLDRETVLAPAIRTARRGFRLDEHAADAANEMRAEIAERCAREQRAANESEGYLLERFCAGGTARVGDVVRLAHQAEALERIAREGERGFYDGAVAEAIVRAVRSAGGVMTAEDLREVRIKEVVPLRGEFRGRTVLAMPLPSSGGITMLMMLGMMDARRALAEGHSADSAAYLHGIIETMKFAFAVRAEYLADDEFADVPVQRLLSADFIAEMSRRVDMHQTHGPEYYASEAEQLVDDGGTSHLSVVDQWGNAVACTETINLEFGSRIVAMPFGFCLNNQMDDFTTRVGEANAFGLRQSEKNLPRAGKRPLSSMSPTIVLGEDGAVEIVAGASGGPRIISGTMQAILNVMLFDVSARDAVSAGRVHHQWMPDVVQVDDWSDEHGARRWKGAVRGLESFGHVVEVRSGESCVQLVRRSRDRSGWEAASDPRKGGVPAGMP